jgi:hypothetical protein
VAERRRKEGGVSGSIDIERCFASPIPVLPKCPDLHLLDLDLEII